MCIYRYRDKLAVLPFAEFGGSPDLAWVVFGDIEGSKNNNNNNNNNKKKKRERERERERESCLLYTSDAADE